ncbi:MAG: bifunctional nuclease family protein, partial [Muribaculaceae bacterium]|nr:bifunctional nuclease family protein [Muribaculaceae bacterium]
RQVVLDSRTSDAIAIAMRTKAPIFTTRAILDETGFVMEIQQSDDPDSNDPDNGRSISDDDITDNEPKLENYAIEELERTLARYIRNEQYEQAARVSEILKRKRGEQ